MGPLTKLFLGRRAMNALFIERDGQCVTYPYWIFGRGVILNEDQKALWEKHTLNFLELLFWTVTIFFIIIYILFVTFPQMPMIYRQNMFLVWLIIIVPMGLLGVYYEITSRKILAGAKRTSQKFTLRDHVEQTAEVLSWPRIILGILAVVIFNLMLLYSFTFHFENLRLPDIITLGISQIFLLSLSVLLVKILIRKLHKRANSTKPDQPAGHC